MPPAPDLFAFSRFQLDARRRILTCNGAPVPLQSRGFDILEYLVRHRHRVVSQDELKAHVWRGLAVADNNLTVQMSALRRALAEHCAGEELILTIPRQGYRFVAEATNPGPTASPLPVASPPPEPPPARRRPYRLALATSLIPTLGLAAWLLAPWPHRDAPTLSIAVLPFRDLSDHQTKDYFVDAIRADLISDLTHVPRATVIAYESTSLSSDDPIQQARRLNVRYAVTGTVRGEGPVFHVNAGLIDTRSDTTLWSSRFDVESGDLSRARDTIERQIYYALDLHLTYVAASRPNDPDAVELFFQGRSLALAALTLEERRAAERLLDRAIARRPDFLEDRAERAWLLAKILRNDDDPTFTADLQTAQADIRAVLAAEPENDVALSAEARLFMVQDDCAAAEERGLRALQAAPSSLDAAEILSDCEQVLGHVDQAARYLAQEILLDPESPRRRFREMLLGHLRLVQGRLEEAHDLLLPLDGGQDFASVMLIADDELAGRHDEARRRLREFNDRWPNRSVWRIEAFYARALAAKPGVQRILAALRAAGMPEYATVPPDGAPQPARCDDTPYAPAPARLPDGETWTADILALAEEAHRPLAIVDVGDGAAVPDGALFMRVRQGDDIGAQVQAELDRNGAADRPIVLVGAGVYGCKAYLIADYLLHHGHAHVAWLRDGEEGVARSRIPHHDHRLL